MDMLDIDGNYGEGGGQILRSSLALSAILNRPIRINRIRAGRKNSGLAPQHLTSVNAVAAITNAEVIGGVLGSDTVTFRPDNICGGNYTFDVADIRPSAGALSLVFQSIALPLSYAKIPSTVTLRGGTHVSWSPTVHYLQKIFIPTAAKFGVEASIQLNRWGWYPKGGGEATAQVQPTANWRGQVLEQRGELRAIHCISAASNLPEHIINRQHNQIQKRLARSDLPISIERIKVNLWGKGRLCFWRRSLKMLKPDSPRSALAGNVPNGLRMKPAKHCRIFWHQTQRLTLIWQINLFFRWPLQRENPVSQPPKLRDILPQTSGWSNSSYLFDLK